MEKKHLIKKHVLIIAFTLCSSLVCLGQSIYFHGIPLGTPYSSFKQQLLSKGYKYLPENSNKGEFFNCYLFDGVFAGELVRINVHVTPKSKIAYCVEVNFKEYAYSFYGRGVTDDLQIAKYSSVKRSISNKYPTTIPHEWSTFDFPNVTDWETSSWRISLFRTWANSEWISLILIYEDKAASRLKDSEEGSDY